MTSALGLSDQNTVIESEFKNSVFLYPEINLVLSKKVQIELSNKKFGLLFPTYINSLLYINMDATAFKILLLKQSHQTSQGTCLGENFAHARQSQPSKRVFEADFFNSIQSI